MSKKQQIFGLLFFMILASNSFYQFKPIQEYEKLTKFVFYLSILITIGFVCFFSFNKKGKLKIYLDRNQPFSLVISLFVITLLSACNAFIYKDQPLLIGLMTSLEILSVYFIFMTVVGLGLNVQQFEKLIVWFGFIYIIILIVGFMTLPNPIFGLYGIDYSRGGVRFRLPGYFWTVALYFYSIEQFKKKGKLKFLAFIIICLIATILTFARQYILYSFVLGFIFYLSGISLKKKLTVILFGFVLFLFVIPNTQIYKNFSSLTQEQLQKNKYEKEDRRVRDYKVFLFDYPRSAMQYLFGCGLASYGNSKYGDEIQRMGKTEGLITADTGWAGFVFYYGYIGAALLLFIISKSLFLRCPKRYIYLKYIILYMSLCSVLGGTILYYEEYLIILLSIYMLYRVSALGKISEKLTSVILYFFQHTIERNLLKKQKTF